MSFEDQVRQALDRLAQELMRSAAAERAQAVKDASEAAAAEVRRQAQAQLGQFRDVAQRHADELRRSAESQIAQLKRSLEETRQAGDQQLAEARQSLNAEVDARRAALSEAENARRQAEAELEAVRQHANAEIESARFAARAEVDEVRRQAEEERSALKSATDERIAELTEEIIQIRKTATSEAEEFVVAQLSAASGDTDRKLADAVERAKTDHHQTVLAQAARLADAVRSLDEGRALGEVLDTLSECAGHEVDRAAVLVVKGERLRGWALSGFGPSGPPPRSIELSLDEAGLPGAVVRTGVAVSRPAVDPGMSSERQPALPPFAQDAGSRHALALPITVGGAVVAVLYADAPRLDAPSASSRWPAILDVLVRHTSRVLEAMTVQHAAGLPLPRLVARASHGAVPGPLEQASAGDEEESARRYARLLLSEIRMYNEPLVDAGRRSRDLLSRLGGEIARARRLYEARIPSSVMMRTDYFDQELVRTLADGDRSLLGGLQ